MQGKRKSCDSPQVMYECKHVIYIKTNPTPPFEFYSKFHTNTKKNPLKYEFSSFSNEKLVGYTLLKMKQVKKGSLVLKYN